MVFLKTLRSIYKIDGVQALSRNSVLAYQMPEHRLGHQNPNTEPAFSLRAENWFVAFERLLSISGNGHEII